MTSCSAGWPPRSRNPSFDRRARFRKHFWEQEGLRKARDLLMLGFMGHEECAAVAEREAIDLTRRRRLRKLIRQRKQIKGG